jgi:predicted TIM-barrel fold metal-dependent hydrolase
LFGVPAVSVYDIDAAIAEMHRAHDMGMVGVMVWQVADPNLPFHSDHYEKLWAAAAEAKAPVHCHILTGHSYTKNASWANRGVFEKIKNSVNTKQADTVNTLYDFVFSGVFDRHPDLKLVLAESEVGWLPYVAQQWDYYYERNSLKVKEMPMKRMPSEIIKEHVYCTFLEDFSGTRHFNWWGQDNCMWSNDYPHFNMTFPNSRANVIRHIGNLPHDVQVKLVRDNARNLYHLDI